MGTISDSRNENEIHRKLIGNKHPKFLPSQPPLKKRKIRANRSSDPWQERFQDLIRFHIRHGHCLVPCTYPEDTTLARWVKRQRYEYKQLLKKQQQSRENGGLKKPSTSSTMNAERIKMLESIGFVWDSHESAWKEKLEELITFKKVHGSCDLPYYYPVNPQLATWATRQRRQYTLYNKGKPSSMTPTRIQALNEIGFKWQMRVIKKSANTGEDQTQGPSNSERKFCTSKIAKAPISTDVNDMTWQSRMGPLPVDLIPISDPGCGAFSESDGRLFLEVLSDLSSHDDSSHDDSVAEARELKPTPKKARTGEDNGLSFHEGILSDVLCDLSVASEEDESDLGRTNPEPFSLDFISVDMDFIHSC
mmetsp:Transcript_10234/g.15026  ORF Transcript_10234/g.15026 Transcript_10234/m.15026 type:complete len:363 (+) Transcript_10234:161-1249(+)